MTSTGVLRRALLYGETNTFPMITILTSLNSVVNHTCCLPVPGSSQRFLAKSRTLSVDCVAYDLEDSVTSDKKVEARALVRSALNLPAPAGVRERAVRINTVESGLALADLTEVVWSLYLISPAFKFQIIIS
jgi:hypothetical protein